VDAVSAGTVVTSPWPLLTLALPLLGMAVASAGRLLGVRATQGLLMLVALGTLLLLGRLLAAVLAAETHQALLWTITPILPLALRADAAGVHFALCAAVIATLTLPYAFAAVRPHPDRWRYFVFIQAAVTCTLGVALAANLLTFFVFFEALSMLSYVLIVHEQSAKAFAAGRVYIIYVLAAGAALLAGVLLVASQAPDLTFAPGGLLALEAAGATTGVALALLLLGFGVKAALVPLHGWVAEAHPAAPVPFSALLSGVMVAVGAFGIVRVLFEVFGAELSAQLGLDTPLAVMAALSVLYGGWKALRSDDLKRRLAYSTISQMGCVTLASALLAAAPLAAALLHIAHHAVLKATLFMAVGLWAHGSGRRRLSELAGVGRRMPFASAAFSVAALGMMGVPPLAGFVSKWWLGIGMLEADAPLALGVLLLGALLSAGYLLPVIWSIYFARVTPEAELPQGMRTRRSEALPCLLLPTLIGAALSLLLAISSAWPGFALDVAWRAAAGLLGLEGAGL
jgi:multicomponent Na+:H+ antiporter subunit D